MAKTKTNLPARLRRPRAKPKARGSRSHPAPDTRSPPPGVPPERVLGFLYGPPEERRERRLVRTALKPNVQAAMAIQEWSDSLGLLDLSELVAELDAQSKLVNGGSLERAEAMFLSQAHTLDAIFNDLARRARFSLTKNLDVSERLLRLAMRAQSQSRATLEGLAEIKNPRQVAFVKQANIAAGHQQVNNGQIARGETVESAPSKLLESSSASEWLDSGATPTAERADQALVPVGAVNRAEDAGR